MALAQTLKDMGWQGFAGALWSGARAQCVPITGTFELTPLCNFRCRMCYMRLDASEVAKYGRLRTADEWLDIARQAMALGTYHVTLTGGEPLMRQDFAQIYQGLVEMGMVVSVMSNGSLITPDIVDLFSRFRPCQLRFTLYGVSDATYERLCKTPDGFTRTMRGLEALRAAGLPFTLAFTETSLNAGDLNEVLAIADRLGANIAVNADLMPAVRGAQSEATALRLPEDVRPHISRPIDNDCPDPLSEYLRTHQMPTNLDDGPFATCKAYRTSFFITWNGKMETCTFMSNNAADPFEDGFAHAWETMTTGLSTLRYPEACRACPARTICPTCPGVRAAMTGSPIGIPQELCEYVRSRYADNLGDTDTTQ